MTLAALVAPSLMIAGIGLAHMAYFRRYAGGQQQQAVALDELAYRGAGGRFRIPGAGSRALSGGRRSSGSFVRLQFGEANSHAPIELFSCIAEPPSIATDGRRMIAGDTCLGSGRFTDTLIFLGDLRVEGHCLFLAPVKIVGDLVVSGNAVFCKPLIVNGNASVPGTVVVRTGMLVKGEASVTGTLVVGERGREAWVVARTIVHSGTVLLNGHADAVGSTALNTSLMRAA